MKNQSKKLNVVVSVDDEILSEHDNHTISKLLMKQQNDKQFRIIKRENKDFTDRYGERVNVFQPILISIARDLKGEDKNVLLLLMGLCEYENEVKVTQAELSKILNKPIPSISRAVRSLERKQFITISRKYNINSYYISPTTSWKGMFENHKKAINEMRKGY